MRVYLFKVAYVNILYKYKVIYYGSTTYDKTENSSRLNFGFYVYI